jgi:drug/metabolite transporter (DMT)-like permease
VTILYGLLSAFSYGYADFFGALAAKKVRALTVTVFSFSVGLAIALIASLFIGSDFSASTLQLGVFAGICSAIAISCLYQALALGPISIVSPFIAVLSALVPVIVDVSLGQKLNAFAGVAIGLILIAVVMVAFVPGSKVRLPSTRAILYSIAAGLSFSGIFLFLDATEKDSGLGPLVVMRSVGILLLLSTLIAVWLRDREKPFIETEIKNLRLIGLIFLAGTGDVIGNIAFLVATRQGALAIAAVLTSLYPVGTILLARIVLKERIALLQAVGIGIALGACVLLALG